MTPEGRVKQKINKVLDKHNAWKFMPVPTGFQTKTVDYLVCCKGRFIAIEAKAPGKAVTDRQAHVLSHIRDAGGLTFVVATDKDVEFLDTVLGEL